MNQYNWKEIINQLLLLSYMFHIILKKKDLQLNQNIT